MTQAFHVIVAMKPLEGNFAENALGQGVAGLSIDECRVEGLKPSCVNIPFESWRKKEGRVDRQMVCQTYDVAQGRFPANVIHDGSKEVRATFNKAGECGGGPHKSPRKPHDAWRNMEGRTDQPSDGGIRCGYSDSGSPARFFKQCQGQAE